MIERLFLICIFLIIYCYFLYPLIITLIARKYEKVVDKKSYRPKVSIVISAYNEEDVIEARIKNLLELDYPKTKYEILIGSDGSDDQTIPLLKKFSDARLSIFDFTERRGKMSVINNLIQHTKGEVIIFTDARQTFSPDAVKELVANFSDPDVGCVSGELILSKGEEATSKGVSLYWNYEKYIRRQESAVHSMLGATGAIYAIRKELFTPIPEDIILDDMYIPFRIIQKGKRAIFDDSAKAYDKAAEDPKEENRRKVRTLSGNYQLFGIFYDMFVPLKSPIALQLFSHKFLRLMVPFLLIGAFILNIFLMKSGFYTALMMLQIMFYSLAVMGGLAKLENYDNLNIIFKVSYIPYVFCLLNYSALMGFYKFMFSRQEVMWQKARES